MLCGYSKEPSQRNACFCVSKRIFFVRLGPSVRLEENNNFWFSILFATKLLLAQTTESSLWNVLNPHALRVEKSEYLNGSLCVDYQLRKGLGFEIWDRIYVG